ncbi:MAG: ABC-type transport auxiliary lipoprotein family protein [Pseudomonadota bacterium]
MKMKLIGLGLATSMLAACVSVLPEPEAPDALYSIEAKAAHAGLAHDVTIREPESARLVAGQGMVSERGDGGLRMVSGAEWAGPATRQIQFAMIDSFETGESGSAVAPELGILTPYEVASRLSALKLNGTRATCEMKVTVIASVDRSLLDQTVVRAEQTATSNSSANRALALRAAASDCASQASLFVIETLRDVS